MVKYRSSVPEPVHGRLDKMFNFFDNFLNSTPKNMRKIFYFICLFILLHCKSKDTPPPSGGMVTPVSMCGSQPTDAAWYSTDQVAPLFEGLGDLHYPITTADTRVQEYFDQGLKWSYAFNHAEAARSFYYATKLDSACAMCHWGFAYVLGPNYNAGMEPDNYQRAYAAVQQAIKYSGPASPKEKAMIQALAVRYVPEPVEDRRALDSAYSAAMKKLHEIYPDDAEIAALYVESVMDLHPWDLWDKKGNPKPWTPEIVAIIEHLLKQYPNHPGFHHFYIHAVEASFNPGRGLESARKFDQGMVPGAGHLVHMPSHIYIRTGDYHEGSLANLNAVRIDSHYVSSCHAQGVYPLAYYPHNYHFLAATATMEGNKDWALMAAHKMREHVNIELMPDPAWATLQHYYTIPYFVQVKFGEWDSILNHSEASMLPYVQVIRHYATGFAWLGKGDISKARQELNTLDSLARDSSLQELTIWGINRISDIVSIASKVLKAEIRAKEKSFEESITLLKEAVSIEDALNYNEPPDWFFSVRHHLGAVLIESGRLDEAIKIYKEDLAWLPKNGWAQHGLKKAYQLKKDQKALAAIEKDLQQSWQYAVVKLDGSRMF